MTTKNAVKMKKRILIKCLCILSWTFSELVCALTFPLPKNGDIVGSIQMTTVRQGESLADIGRRYDVGIYEMIEANPKIDPWIPPARAVVVIPTQFILPRGGNRKGIVLNLAELRLYYFHPDKPLVTTHPIGIGKKAASTPLVQSKITDKKKDPTWVPTESIRREHLAKGDRLPAAVPPGPDNPLGRYILYLPVHTLRIHGTNRPGSVGVRCSHGCIRMLPEDIASMYYNVPVGTPVQIIHEPYKVGWHRDRLYLEAHQPLTEGKYAGSDSLNNLKHAIEAAINSSHVVNWTSAQMAARAKSGYPTRID